MWILKRLGVGVNRLLYAATRTLSGRGLPSRLTPRMKYVIVIPDGCADEPQASLGDKTPLQAARKPNMDRVAQTGVVGRSNNVPRPLTPASDVATLSLFGYDPLAVYTGRAPLETAAMGVALGPNDWAIRCNLVHVENGEMRDFTAGHIASEEGRPLVEAVQAALGGPTPGGRLEFHPGVSYRNILVFRADKAAPFAADTKTQPPHDIPDKPIADHLPKGPGSDLLRDLMERSQAVLAGHPVNKARVDKGKRPATQIWLWGQGKAPTLQPFAEKYGKRGAILSAVDLVRGVGVLLGWKRIDVPAPPATSTPTTPPRAATPLPPWRTTTSFASTSRRRTRRRTKGKRMKR